MTKRKGTKRQTIDNKAQQRKLKLEQYKNQWGEYMCSGSVLTFWSTIQILLTEI